MSGNHMDVCYIRTRTWNRERVYVTCRIGAVERMLYSLETQGYVNCITVLYGNRGRIKTSMNKRPIHQRIMTSPTKNLNFVQRSDSRHFIIIIIIDVVTERVFHLISTLSD